MERAISLGGIKNCVAKNVETSIIISRRKSLYQNLVLIAPNYSFVEVPLVRGVTIALLFSNKNKNGKRKNKN